MGDWGRRQECEGVAGGHWGEGADSLLPGRPSPSGVAVLGMKWGHCCSRQCRSGAGAGVLKEEGEGGQQGTAPGGARKGWVTIIFNFSIPRDLPTKWLCNKSFGY